MVCELTHRYGESVYSEYISDLILSFILFIAFHVLHFGFILSHLHNHMVVTQLLYCVL